MTPISRPFWLSCFVTASIGFGVPIAGAELITFTHEGSGSGSLNAVPFADLAFTITAVADTEDRVPLGTSGTPGSAVSHQFATIELEGLGLFEFVTDTRTFVNRGEGLVGFGRSRDGGVNGSDLFNGPGGSDLLASYELDVSIGPIAGSALLLQWNSVASGPVLTSGGQLFFSDEFVPATFTATLVPEPGLAGLMLIGLPLTVCRRRVS